MIFKNEQLYAERSLHYIYINLVTIKAAAKLVYTFMFAQKRLSKHLNVDSTYTHAAVQLVAL